MNFSFVIVVVTYALFLISALLRLDIAGFVDVHALEDHAGLKIEVDAIQGMKREENIENDNASASKNHTNTWAVIVDTSTFWFNYRHIANALTVYHIVKDLGLPDSRIILMLADDIPCNPRNIQRGEVFNDMSHNIELYGKNVQVDYRGNEVTVDNFLRLLTGRHPPGTPSNKRLDTDASSNILLFMTGHGGDEFLKFQDTEEISAHDIADAVLQMHEKGRYHEMMFLVDTCQATTLFNRFKNRIPNVVCAGSSILGESSYSHHNDYELGIPIIDRFTHVLSNYFEEKKRSDSNDLGTAQELFSEFIFSKLRSTLGTVSTMNRPLDKVLVEDFFGSTTKAVWHPIEAKEDAVKNKTKSKSYRPISTSSVY